MDEESWRRHHGGRHLEEASWMSNHGGDIMVEASGGSIMDEESWHLEEEASWMRNHGVTAKVTLSSLTRK